MTSEHKLVLSIHELKIPFKVSFKHASAQRSVTESVLVQVKSPNGVVGYGESCPRHYVTGETISSVKKYFSQHQTTIEKNIDGLAKMKQWMQNHSEEIENNPAAWCAIELALLDLFAKQQQVPVEQLLELPQISGTFTYSAVLGDSDEKTFQRQYQQYRSMGFKDFKLKLSGRLERDRNKLGMLNHSSGADLRVRFDANNLWRDVDTANDYLTDLNSLFFAIEEPLASKNIAQLAELVERINSKIILDESFISPSQISMLEEVDPNRWIINVRVSKMGGILRALEVVQLARQRKIPIIVGAQVGETSLLTRAALTVANAARDMLVAQEGAFGTLLLEDDVWQPSLMFAKAGALSSEKFDLENSSGFGLEIDLSRDVNRGWLEIQS